MIKSNLEQVLKKNGRSAYWLSKQLGIKPQSIYPYVHGTDVPSLMRALQMAKHLDCKVDDLFELVDDNEEQTKNRLI